MAKEKDLVERIGIDAVLFIRFMAMCRNMFLIFAVIGCTVIIPINVIYNLKNPLAETASKSDAFFLMTPTLIYGNTLFAQVVVTWAFDIIICYFLWTNFNKIIQLRRNKFMSEEYQNALFMRSLMVTEIPKKYISDSGLITLMSKLKVTRPIQNASVGRDVTRLAKLIDKHEETVLKLESVLSKYLKDPNNLPARRPTCSAYKEDNKFNGSKVDAIDYLCSRMESLEKQIEKVRDAIDKNKGLPYGFVSYESAEDCHIVAKSTRQRRKGKLTATLAPRPADIIWKNIVLTRVERKSKQLWGNFLFVCLMVGWIAPNALMGTFLSQLSRIGVLWPPFNTFMINYPVIFSILQGVLSPIITSLVFLILPAIMRRMAQWQGRVTRHEREIDVTKKLYTFFIFNNLFVFTIFSVVWSVVSTIITLVQSGQNLTFQGVMNQLELAQQISQAILGASSFWVMYILRVNFGAILDLLQLVSLFWRGFQRNFMSPTPRELMLWTAPQHFNFAAYYNWLLFYTTIALCFSMVQPLVLPVIALYFTLDVIYKKYSLMYIFATKVESDGLYWPFLFNAFLFATGFGNVVLFAVIWVQGGWRIAICLAPLLPLLIIFKIISHKIHNDRFYYFIPTEEEKRTMSEIRTRTNLSDISHHALEKRYRNPAITTKPIVPMVHAKAQHILPEICSLSNFNQEVDMQTAFATMDERFEPNFQRHQDQSYMVESNKRQSRISVNGGTGGGGFKFDIVDEMDLTYERYQEIERARIATPFDPNLTNDNATLYSTKIAGGQAPPLPQIPKEYERGQHNPLYGDHSNNSSHSVFTTRANTLTSNTYPNGSLRHLTSQDSLVSYQQPPPMRNYYENDDVNSIHSISDTYYHGNALQSNGILVPTHGNGRDAQPHPPHLSPQISHSSVHRILNEEDRTADVQRIPYNATARDHCNERDYYSYRQESSRANNNSRYTENGDDIRSRNGNHFNRSQPSAQNSFADHHHNSNSYNPYSTRTPPPPPPR